MGRWVLAPGSRAQWLHVTLYHVIAEQHIFCFNTDFVGSVNKTIICLILSTIYIFIPASGCHCLVQGAHKAAE